jgi:uncharacterized membrane-anchored protein
MKICATTLGETAGDLLSMTLDVGYAASSLRRAELFDWIAILFSNTLGTALGDFLADSSGLGFAGGALLIGGLLALTIIAKYLTSISTVLLFWIAFVLTRPLGATVGDLLTKTHAKGGFGFGTVGSSLVLFTILAVLILHANRLQQRASARAS